MDDGLRTMTFRLLPCHLDNLVPYMDSTHRTWVQGFMGLVLLPWILWLPTWSKMWALKTITNGTPTPWATKLQLFENSQTDCMLLVLYNKVWFEPRRTKVKKINKKLIWYNTMAWYGFLTCNNELFQHSVSPQKAFILHNSSSWLVSPGCSSFIG